MARQDSQPQLKDQDLYEDLRKKGIRTKRWYGFPTQPPIVDARVGRSGGTSSRHEERTVEELKERAKELDLHGYSKLKKSELIDTLRRH